MCYIYATNMYGAYPDVVFVNQENTVFQPKMEALTKRGSGQMMVSMNEQKCPRMVSWTELILKSPIYVKLPLVNKLDVHNVSLK